MNKEQILKEIKGYFLAMLVLAVIAVVGVLSVPGVFASAGNHVTVEEKADLCPKVIQFEEKYKEDFFIEEGHKFYMRRCTKEAVDELRWLLEKQQDMDYPDLEKAKTAKRLSHAIYGNGICYHNIVNYLAAAQEFAKDAVMLNQSTNDCLTLALAGVKERKECKSSAGGVCVPKSAPKAGLKE